MIDMDIDVKKRALSRKRRRSNGEDAEAEAPNAIKAPKSAHLSGIPFSSLKGKISDRTLKKLDHMGFKLMTEIQAKAIEPLLEAKDVVGAAKTGSGKTLAFLIAVLECLYRNKWTQADGLGALIIVPTRELAYQIYEVINKVGAEHTFSIALLIGGTEVEYQLKRLYAINIVICTPGRLLQHLEENSNFKVDQLQILVIDEADRILDFGFRKQMDSILEYLPPDRQTLLFSATQTRKVEDLARVSVKEPVFVDVQEHANHATPDALQQRYVLIKDEQKMNFLWSFLINHKYKKTLIFVTCCRQARFLTEMLKHLRPGLPLMGLWGGQKQHKRLETFGKFDRNVRGAAMIATDIASRGLDFSGVDWVFQLDCPATIDDYVHRVGRTARMEKSGDALLVLTPAQEQSFVKMLQSRHIPIEPIQFNERRIVDISGTLSTTIATFTELKDFAQRAIVDYARAVYNAKLKSVFDVKAINVEELAKSYGLAWAPRLRFLRKKQENGNQDGATLKEEPIASSDDSEDEEPILTLVNRHEPLKAEEDEEEVANVNVRPKKVVTKQQHIKKLLKKKNIIFNTHIKYDDAGANG